MAQVYLGNGRADGLDFRPDRSPATRRAVWKKALSKYLPYYGQEFVLFLLLAWPRFGKVLLARPSGCAR
jgi:linoleoyl-CoA desaturase